MIPPKENTSKKPSEAAETATYRLLQVMQRLRDPKTGCPWDVQQDFKSIAPYTIEEAYEVADAIDRGDMDHLKEELGDLLLQVVFHARMAEENGHFDFADVASGIAEKMIRRHPHVFGDEKADAAHDVHEIWDKQKDKEQQGDSALDGVALGLPALMRAQKLQKRAARAGFEWKDAAGAFEKMQEELEELAEAIEEGNQAHITEEFGDVMFCLVNYGRMLGIDAETTLRGTNSKFTKRFSGMETDLKQKHNDLKNTPLDEMLESWDKQKTVP